MRLVSVRPLAAGAVALGTILSQILLRLSALGSLRQLRALRFSGGSNPLAASELGLARA